MTGAAEHHAVLSYRDGGIVEDNFNPPCCMETWVLSSSGKNQHGAPSVSEAHLFRPSSPYLPARSSEEGGSVCLMIPRVLVCYLYTEKDTANPRRRSTTDTRRN